MVADPSHPDVGPSVMSEKKSAGAFEAACAFGITLEVAISSRRNIRIEGAAFFIVVVRMRTFVFMGFLGFNLIISD